jgi:hypothetical protein
LYTPHTIMTPRSLAPALSKLSNWTTIRRSRPSGRFNPWTNGAASGPLPAPP